MGRAAGTIGVALVVAAGGCLSTPPDPLWMQQRQSVGGIRDAEQRNKALAQVCESAAHAGDAAAVKLMLGDLDKDPRHDDLAGRCAAALAGRDKANARRIAKLITDDGKRDAALARVEKTEEVDKP